MLQNRMLGKLPAKHNPRSLVLAKYLPEKELAIPTVVDNFSKVKAWGMMGNDSVGDCAYAAPGHMEQVWTAARGNEITIPTAEILAAYSAGTGYDPNQTQPDGSNPTDQGSNESDVLDQWQKVGIGGHKIDAFASVEPTSDYQMRLTTWLFGAAYVGVELPLSAQGQRIWNVVPGPDSRPGSWGGHAICLPGFDAHRFMSVSWGDLYPMTRAWWRKYGDEAHAVLSEEWVDEASREAPNHLKWDELKADLTKFFPR